MAGVIICSMLQEDINQYDSELVWGWRAEHTSQAICRPRVVIPYLSRCDNVHLLKLGLSQYSRRRRCRDPPRAVNEFDSIYIDNGHPDPKLSARGDGVW